MIKWVRSILIRLNLLLCDILRRIRLVSQLVCHLQGYLILTV